MRGRSQPLSMPKRLFAALAVGCASMGAQAQAAWPSPNYTLTAPALLAVPEEAPIIPLAAFGPLRLGVGGMEGGSGLSLEAGESWFARAAIGRSVDAEVLSLGGGYRFGRGDALSMVVTRQLGQDGLGLAVRYDWRQAWLRLSYEQPLRNSGSDRLRFSAGVRF